LSGCATDAPLMLDAVAKVVIPGLTRNLVLAKALNSLRFRIRHAGFDPVPG